MKHLFDFMQQTAVEIELLLGCNSMFQFCTYHSVKVLVVLPLIQNETCETYDTKNTNVACDAFDTNDTNHKYCGLENASTL